MQSIEKVTRYNGSENNSARTYIEQQRLIRKMKSLDLSPKEKEEIEAKILLAPLDRIEKIKNQNETEIANTILHSRAFCNN